jgi:hypothetical protein
VGIVYLAIVLAYLPHIVASVATNSDASSVQLVSELYSHRAGGTVYLSTLPWYSTLIFSLATKWLPAHREIWGIAPFVFGLIAIGLMVWTARRLAGRWAATVTGVLMVCASPLMFEQMFWLDNHMTTYYSLALVVAFMVLLEERADSLSPALLLGLTLLIGVIVGANAASDDLLLVSGPGPLLLAGGVAWFLHPSARAARAMGLLVLLVVVAGASGAGTLLVVHSADIVPRTVPVTFATNEAVLGNFMFWWESIALLGNGSFFGAAITATSALYAICAALSLSMLFVIPSVTRRHLQGRLAKRRPEGAGMSAYLVFWTASATLLSVAFIFSSTLTGLSTTRYLGGFVFAAAAVVPMWARRSSLAQGSVVLGTLIFSITSLISLINSGLLVESMPGPTRKVAAEVAKVAENLHATQGYAQYWVAAPITWGSHFRVHAYPIFGCLEAPQKMCPGPVNYITTWYKGLSTKRTFLILNSVQTPVAPPRELGPAAATYRFGNVTMYIYDYDIARYLD